MMPIFSQIGLSGPNTNGINMRTPIDNGALYIYRLRWSYNPIPETEIHDYKYSNYSYPEMQPGTYTPKDNMTNDYNIDRVTQRNFSYTGIRAFPTQDTALIENQWGPVANRWREHLGSSDQQIIHIRRRLMASARALAAGTEPPEVLRPEGYAWGGARVVRDGTKEEAIEQAKVEAKDRSAKTPIRARVAAAGL